MLDCAVHISLLMLEIILYERVIEAKDAKPMGQREADHIDEGIWDEVVKHKTTLKFLGKISELEMLQKSYQN